MPDSCTCGARLPPDARFCHKCGRPLFDPTPEEIEIQTPAPAEAPPPPQIGFGNRTAVRAGFLAALLAALLAIFPLPFQILGFLGSGFLAVYLYNRRTGQPLTLLSGARMGWITGIFAFTIFMVQLTVTVVAASPQGGFAAFLLKQQPPPRGFTTQQFMEIMQQPAALIVMMLVIVVFFFIFLTLLSTLGGLLGAKVLARQRRTL